VHQESLGADRRNCQISGQLFQLDLGS